MDIYDTEMIQKRREKDAVFGAFCLRLIAFHFVYLYVYIGEWKNKCLVHNNTHSTAAVAAIILSFYTKNYMK